MMNRFRERFARFMAGRYGADKLGRLFIVLSLVLIVLGMFVRKAWVDILVLLCLGICYYRMFSKNIRKRYEENQRYEALLLKVSGRFGGTRYKLDERRRYHIYKCPQCGQKIRVPRGKGRISIHCPQCGQDFIKKS